jgi:hypothetical protein
MEISPELESKLEQIAKLPRVARAGIVFGTSIIVAASYYFMWYSGTQTQLQQLRVQEAELQRKLGEVRSVTSNLAAFEEEITQLEGKLARVLRQLPNKKELEVLLTDVSNLGKTVGIEIKRLLCGGADLDRARRAIPRPGALLRLGGQAAAHREHGLAFHRSCRGERGRDAPPGLWNRHDVPIYRPPGQCIAGASGCRRVARGGERENFRHSHGSRRAGHDRV